MPQFQWIELKLTLFSDTAIFSLRHHHAARLLEASVEAPSGASEASSAAAFGTSFTTRLCTFLVVVLVGATESRLKSREKGTMMRKDHCLNMLEFLLDILGFFYLQQIADTFAEMKKSTHIKRQFCFQLLHQKGEATAASG